MAGKWLKLRDGFGTLSLVRLWYCPTSYWKTLFCPKSRQCA
jgi:hypothetical protein